MWLRNRNDEIGNRKKYVKKSWSILINVEELTLESLRDPDRVLYLITAEGIREKTLHGNLWGYQRENLTLGSLREPEKEPYLGTSGVTREKTLPGNLWGYQRERENLIWGPLEGIRKETFPEDHAPSLGNTRVNLSLKSSKVEVSAFWGS